MVSGAMMIVRRRVHGEQLVVHAKRRLAPGFDFMRAWKREAQPAKTL